MDKTLFLKEADRMSASERNTVLSPDTASSTKEYVYKKAAPVTVTKSKRDEAGFIVPYAMFRPIREPSLLCELLGDNPVRRCADLKMNLDFLMKEAYRSNSCWFWECSWAWPQVFSREKSVFCICSGV